MSYTYKMFMGGFPVFLKVINRPKGNIGPAICDQCRGKYLAIRRTDRFCSIPCRTSFLKELREFEARFGKLQLAPDEKEIKRHKPKQVMCKAFGCKKRFNTYSHNHRYCSDKCKALGALFNKHKNNPRKIHKIKWLIKKGLEAK